MRPAWIPPVPTAAVKQARRIDDARAAATYVRTPQPVYVEQGQPTARPISMPPQEAVRIKSAAAAARRAYPNVVGELIARELNFHAEAGWMGDTQGMVARLVSHLLDPPPREAA